MNELKVVANDMFPVYQNKESENLVDARSLHTSLLIATRFNDWISRMITNYGFIEGEDFYSDLSKTTGRPSSQYYLTLDTAKEIAMVQNNEQGRIIRKYFIQVEKQLRQMSLPSYMIDDPIKRAEKWITERKEFESVIEQQKLDQPYTNFGKTVSNSDGSISIGAFAKMIYNKHGIKIGRNKMFEFLREKGYLIKSGRERNNPKQIYIEQGLFEVKPSIVSTTKGDIESVTTLVTGKGQFKLTELFKNEAV